MDEIEPKTLVGLFLRGYASEDKKGGSERVYLPAGGTLEIKARAALSAMLRQGAINQDHLNALADLVAPDEDDFADQRKLVLRNRKGGAQNQIEKKSAIFQTLLNAVAEERGVDAGISEVIESYGVSREYAYRVWAHFKPLRQALGLEVNQ